MKIYLAGTAPGNENKKINKMIFRRLLSYYFLENNLMDNVKCFDLIKQTNYENLFSSSRLSKNT
jgi:hypothetical protein